jgi:hypothetical protein
MLEISRCERFILILIANTNNCLAYLHTSLLLVCYLLLLPRPRRSRVGAYKATTRSVREWVSIIKMRLDLSFIYLCKSGLGLACR